MLGNMVFLRLIIITEGMQARLTIKSTDLCEAGPEIRSLFCLVQILNRQVCYFYFRSKIVLPACDVFSVLCAGSKMLTKSVERGK